MKDGEKHRQRMGYTRAAQIADANAWFRLASGFHLASNLLDELAIRIPNDTRPFAFNAALSIELILKAIIATKNKSIPDAGRAMVESW